MKLPIQIQIIKIIAVLNGSFVCEFYLFITKSTDYQFSMVRTWNIVNRAYANSSKLFAGIPSGSFFQ